MMYYHTVAGWMLGYFVKSVSGTCEGRDTAAINGVLKMGRAGDWSCHLIEHEMSAQWDIAHGAGLACITPIWMRYVYEEDIEIFAKLGVNVFGLDYDFDNPKATAEETIRRFEAFFKSLGMPTRIRDFRFNRAG